MTEIGVEWGAASLACAKSFLDAYRLPQWMMEGPLYQYGWKAWTRGAPMPLHLKHRKAIQGYLARAAHEASR